MYAHRKMDTGTISLFLLSLTRLAYSDSVCKEVFFDREINLKFIAALGVDTEPAQTLYDCALHCAQFSDCHSANWDQVGKICILFDRIPREIPEFTHVRPHSAFGLGGLFGSRLRNADHAPIDDTPSIWKLWNRRRKRQTNPGDIFKFVGHITEIATKRKVASERSATGSANQQGSSTNGPTLKSPTDPTEKPKFKQKPGYIYLYNVQCTEWSLAQPKPGLMKTSKPTTAPSTHRKVPRKTPGTPVKPSTTMIPAPKLPKRHCSKIDLAFKLVRGRMDYLPIIATIKGVLTERKCAQHCYKILLCTEANYFAMEKECELMSAWLTQDIDGTNLSESFSNLTDPRDSGNYDYSEETGLDMDSIGVIKNIDCAGDEEKNAGLLEALMTFLRWLAMATSASNPGGSGFGFSIPGLNSGTFGGSQVLPGLGGLFGTLAPPPPKPTPSPSKPKPSEPSEGTNSGSVSKPGSEKPTSGDRSCGVPAITPRVTEFSMRTALEIGETRIVGGTEARPHSWPWQAGIIFLGRQICGGSIIDEQHILTAAHCVYKNVIPGNYKVILGAHQKAGLSAGDGKIIKVSKIFIHPTYNSPRHAFDVAVLRLENPVLFDEHINAICLAQRDVLAGTQCVTSGWGATQGAPTTRLQQVVVPVIENSVCNDAQHYFGRIHSAMLCAGYEEGGKDSCKGDSGGPLVCPSGPNRWEQHGIVSWGFGCAQRFKPGVYVRIPEVKHWILQKMAQT